MHRVDTGHRQQALEELRRQLVSSDAYQECCGERNLVFGEGSVDARLVLVGEAPGGQEDRQRRPFVGPAGKLLNEALATAGASRDEVWITNVVKCRPTVAGVGGRLKNRAPSPEEVERFLPWLEREVAILAPNAILCLGATAAGALLGRPIRITQERGQWSTGPRNVPTIATYHPAYLLRQVGSREQRYGEFVEDIRNALLRATHSEG